MSDRPKDRAWMSAAGGKWHFFTQFGDRLVSACNRHALRLGTDLTHDGYKSTAACKDCLTASRKQNSSSTQSTTSTPSIEPDDLFHKQTATSSAPATG